MPKCFWQCDVTDREDNIWTGPVVYGSHQEAEFQTMLALQSDWGDEYMPEGFDLTEFPGDDLWDLTGYWDELDVNTFMLLLDPVTALAKLGKIKCDLPDDIVGAAMAGQAQLHVVVNMKEA